MDASVWVAIITGVASVLAVVITNSRSNAERDNKMERAQAVTDTKLEELTREVRLHNNFAERIPVLEEQNKALNKRVTNLEQRKGA
jgi:hypothetical protein|nr:MAG TPA: hypothetical protein [Caudoviricetes sp.]